MVFMLTHLVLLGFVGSGVIWICFLLCLTGLVRLVGCTAQYLALCRLCSELRSGGVLVALQGCLRIHVGVNNLNVVNHISGIIAGRRAGQTFLSGQ